MTRVSPRRCTQLLRGRYKGIKVSRVGSGAAGEGMATVWPGMRVLDQYHTAGIYACMSGWREIEGFVDAGHRVAWTSPGALEDGLEARGK